jgi:hypothetical protein
VFDQVNGLPVHALVVHTAVVFVPLLVLGAIVYALVARWRSKIAWAVALLAVVAPICTLVAKLSGEKLYDRLVANGLKGKGLEILNQHVGFGGQTFWFTLALGVVTLIVVGLNWRRSSPLPFLAQAGAAVVVIALAAAAGYYVYRTGDSGATAVWGQY